MSGSIPLTSSSNYSLTKKRIFMLTKSKSRKSIVRIRILLTLSLMTLVFILQSFQNSGKDVNGFVVSKYGKHLSGVQIYLSDQKNKITSDAMGHFVIKNIPENATITISAKNYVSQTVSPIFSSEMVIRLTPDVSNDKLKKNYKDFFPEPGSNPLIVINGVVEERVSMADIDPTNKVASLKILSDKAASTKYGEKAKNGAIEIITINDNAAEQTVKMPSADSPEYKVKTLVLLDGKVYTGDIKDIPVQSVKNLSVRNYTDAYDKYGEKGKEKVIEITTK
jgi:bla regulator protein blaR1